MPSRMSGRGAMIYPGGTGFRVWAPHADAVSVIGDFNGEDDTANPLDPEDGGWWSADVDGAVAGQAYRYRIVRGREVLKRKDPYGRDVRHSNGPSVITDPAFDWGSGEFVPPAWNDLIIYEMHVGTFHDQPGGAPGTFDTAIARLPHIVELGANAVEVMPLTEFPGAVSWGYNPADPFAVESDYGGPLAFKRFVKAAHALGIAVIVDVVYNHFGPSDLDLWQFDGWHENDKGGIYFYNDHRSRTPWGDTRPDYGRSEVRDYLRDNALMWLDEYRADGLRWDMTLFMRTIHGSQSDTGQSIPDGWRVMQEINEAIDARWPGKISIAEDLQDNQWVTKETGAGGAGFDAQWADNFRRSHPPQRDRRR